MTGTISNVIQKDGQDGKGNNRYLLDITKDGQQIVSQGYLAAKTFEPKVGEEFEFTVRNGDYGPVLKRHFDTPYEGNGSAPASSGGNRPDATGRSIERQVALKAAVAASSQQLRTDNEVIALAEKFDTFLTSARAGGNDSPPDTAGTPVATPQGTAAANGADSGQPIVASSDEDPIF